MTCSVTSNLTPQETESTVETLTVSSAVTLSPIESSVIVPSVTTNIVPDSIHCLLESVVINRVGDMLEQSLQLGENTTSDDVYKAVCLINNKVYLGDINNEDRRDIIGILLSFGNVNEYVTVKTGGDVSNILWSWLPSSENKIYLGGNLPTSNLTQTIPDSNAFVEVAVPLSPSILSLRIIPVENFE